MKITKILITILIYTIIPLTNIKAIDTYSENAILYNLNDEKIIYEKNSKQQVKVASLTKIMTTIIALENIDNIKDYTIMPQEAYKDLDGYVLSGIKPNEKVTYEDILYGIMLPSGADCANAVALKISNTIDEFVDLMNKKAQELNMNNTHFSNPIGMDDDNYSTVEDISKLLKYSLKNQEFYKIFTTKEYTTTNNIKMTSTIIEKSKPYNIDISNILGSKTGFTDEAGNCLASIAKINNIKYLLVTTNASIKNSYHILDAANIYDYFSKNYSYKKILKYNQKIKTINIDDYINKEYEIKSDKDIYLYLKNDIDLNQITYEYEGIEKITKDIKQNEKIGTLNVKYNNEIIYKEDILLNKKITFYNIKTYILSLIATIIITITLIIKRKKRKIYKRHNIIK